MKRYCKAVVNIVVAIVIALLVIFFLPRLLAFFAPFVIGWIIAWMAGPPVRFFEEKLKIKRRAGSAVVIIAVIALIVFAIYGLGSILVKEGMGFAQAFPDIWKEVHQDLDEIEDRLDKLYQNLPVGIRGNLDGVVTQLKASMGDFLGKLSSPTLTAVGNFAKYLPTLLICIVMALLSAYFFVADRENINAWCRKHVPKVVQERYRLMKQGLLRAVGEVSFVNRPGNCLSGFSAAVWCRGCHGAVGDRQDHRRRLSYGDWTADHLGTGTAAPSDHSAENRG